MQSFENDKTFNLNYFLAKKKGGRRGNLFYGERPIP